MSTDREPQIISQRVAIFGTGAIGQGILRDWPLRAGGATLVGICARPTQASTVVEIVGSGVPIVAEANELLDLKPDIVVESAGHAGAIAIAEPTLERGATLLLLSVGILADAGTRKRLSALADRHGGRLVIPAGALAGFDGIASIAQVPGAEVTYRSIKPPHAWRGTPAEQVIDLDRTEAATVFFRGNAAEAASAYPKNANLAAAVALAGIGFEATKIELVADPASLGNTGIVEASNGVSSLKVTLSGAAAVDNPKTSAIVADSVFASLSNLRSRIAFA